MPSRLHAALLHLSSIVLALAVAGTAGAAEEGFALMPAAEVARALGAKDLAVFDANGAESFAAGHVPGARHLGDFLDYPASVLPADKTTRIVFYCRNKLWMASHQSARRAVKLGYQRVFVMPDGIDGWRAGGHPVEKR